MFEKLFLPYLFEHFQNNPDDLEALTDPIDACMRSVFEQTKNVHSINYQLDLFKTNLADCKENKNQIKTDRKTLK